MMARVWVVDNRTVTPSTGTAKASVFQYRDQQVYVLLPRKVW